MTNNEFGLCLIGQGAAECIVNGEWTRLRYIVADAIDQRASERQRAGRPDKAGVLRYISGEIRHGGVPSKRSLTKAGSDVREVERRVVDGVSLTGR
jgi:hypothetical protein